MPESRCAYVIVPFQRVGCKVEAQQPVQVDAVGKARRIAQRLAASLPGVAVLEREIDAETGVGRESLIAAFGAVPRGFPEAPEWTLPLN